jgi:hypothetical protein
MSSGNRQRRGGGKRPPQLTPEEFETWEPVPEEAERKLPPPADPLDSLHFGERQDERGTLTEADLHRLQHSVPYLQRRNNTIARVINDGGGHYRVVARTKDGSGVTVMKLTKLQVKEQSISYDWNPPFE